MATVKNEDFNSQKSCDNRFNSRCRLNIQKSLTAFTTYVGQLFNVNK